MNKSDLNSKKPEDMNYYDACSLAYPCYGCEHNKYNNDDCCAQCNTSTKGGDQNEKRTDN